MYGIMRENAWDIQFQNICLWITFLSMSNSKNNETFSTYR